MPTAAFAPQRDGFAFANRFVDELLRLPSGQRVTTAGRCGGMAYLALDYVHAHRPTPRAPASFWAPTHVPPDGHWLADAIRARLFDSFRVRSAQTFVTWSLLPDGPVEAFGRELRKGVRRWTAEDELPRVVAAVDAGTPVPLGLVVARSLPDIGRNHQVVVYGYERADDAAGTVRLVVHDNNTPDRAVTLTPGPDGWHASNGPVWRGFFVQDYTPEPPPPLPLASAEPSRPVRIGDELVLGHVWTGRVLHASAGRTPASGQQPVDAASTLDDAARWLLTARHTGAPDAGRAVTTGDVVRLRNVAGRRNLHSHATHRSPVSDEQEVTAFGEGGIGDANDDWRVEVEGGGPWLAGRRVRLVHARTGAALRSRRGRLPGSPSEHPRGEVSADAPSSPTLPRDADWWTVAAP